MLLHCHSVKWLFLNRVLLYSSAPGEIRRFHFLENLLFLFSKLMNFVSSGKVLVWSMFPLFCFCVLFYVRNLVTREKKLNVARRRKGRKRRRRKGRQQETQERRRRDGKWCSPYILAAKKWMENFKVSIPIVA